MDGYISTHTKIFTLQFENDRWKVETSLFFNVNFFSEVFFYEEKMLVCQSRDTKYIVDFQLLRDV